MSVLVASVCTAYADSAPAPTAGMKDQDRWPQLSSPLPTDVELEAKITALLERMSPEEKVGQIIQGEIKHVTPDDVRTYHLGSVLNGGGTFPGNDKYAKASDWMALSDAYRQASMDTSGGRTAIPIIWGSDAVHGHNNAFGATVFPHNIGLGATGDPALVRRIGRATAAEVRATGIQWVFAPTVAVARDHRWGRTYESYGEDPELVANMAAALVDGLQGDLKDSARLEDEHVLATAKHFVGDGGTSRGVDRGDTALDEATLIDTHARGYFSTLEGGVQTVMASFNSWNGEKLHGHKYLLTTVLKERLGFDGFVVGDWNGHRYVPGCRADSCPAAINAGLDMFMAPSEWKPLYHNTLSQVRSGEISAARLDDAVRRILRVKLRAGLFSPVTAGTSEALGHSTLGADSHRAIAREAVRKSLVLLKNEKGLLPLSPQSNVLVIGEAANDVGQQSGGWTLSWQGTGNTREDFPNATSVLEGLRAAVNGAGGEVVYVADGQVQEKTFRDGRGPDVAIAVFGEEPYAEWHGDVSATRYGWHDRKTVRLLEGLQQQGTPVVSIFLSGRPLWVNPEMNRSNAFVAAWLPGTEGAGVADVLLRRNDGTIKYDFTGRLSFAWPTEIGTGESNLTSSFPVGYGLRYGESVEVAMLPESSSIPEEEPQVDERIYVYRANAPWRVALLPEDGVEHLLSGNRLNPNDDDRLLAETEDQLYQEDALRLTWGETGEGLVHFGAGEPQDLSRFADAGGALSLDMRLHHPNGERVEVAMACEGSCSQWVDITDRLAAFPQKGDWQRLSINLQCFLKSNEDLKAVTSALVLRTTGSSSLSVANVRIVSGVSDAPAMDCGTSK